MSTLTNVCRVQEETKEVTSVKEGHDVERVVEDDIVKLAREQVQQNQYIDRVMNDSSCT